MTTLAVGMSGVLDNEAMPTTSVGMAPVLVGFLPERLRRSSAMRKRWIAWAVALGLAAGSVGRGGRHHSDQQDRLFGARDQHVRALKVEYEQSTVCGVQKEVPVNEILTIIFNDDPKELKRAKDYIVKDRYAEAAAALEGIKEEPGQPEVRLELEYYRALCDARLALANKGETAEAEKRVADAGRRMKAFADAHPNSYHYFEATALVGDLLLAFRQYPQAAEYYGRLAKAPWPDYQMRAGVAVGRTLLAQGKNDEAVAVLDKVIASAAIGDLADAQRTLATLQKANALVALQKPDEAIVLAERVLANADPGDAVVKAQAYNIMGTAHRQAGRTEEALFAFLHVDFFYSEVPTAHAEALWNLAALWEQLHKIERANAARKTLEEHYKDSRWAKKK